MMFQTALKYHIEVSQTKQVEFPVPYSAGTPITVLVFKEQPTDNLDHSESTIEVLVAELYAADQITFKQAQQLLNHTDWQDTVTVLTQQGCQLYYDKDDYQQDLETLALVNK
jgi:predicted HTH domain antitoxin